MIKYIALLWVATLIACTQTQKQEKTGSLEDQEHATLDVDLPEQKSAKPSQLMEQTIEQFIVAYNARNSEQANSLIHPDIGITIIHRPGAIDWFEKVDKLDFNHPIPSYYPYDKAVSNYTLVYDSAPRFSCETETWNKLGLFVDLTEQTHVLQTIANYLKEYNDVELEHDYLSSIEKAETNSYRVVLTSKVPLVFHIKEVDGKWYVTILDRSYGDCSA